MVVGTLTPGVSRLIHFRGFMLAVHVWLRWLRAGIASMFQLRAITQSGILVCETEMRVSHLVKGDLE